MSKSLDLKGGNVFRQSYEILSSGLNGPCSDEEGFLGKRLLGSPLGINNALFYS
jgi:hypothetical protein